MLLIFFSIYNRIIYQVSEGPGTFILIIGNRIMVDLTNPLSVSAGFNRSLSSLQVKQMGRDSSQARSVQTIQRDAKPGTEELIQARSKRNETERSLETLSFGIVSPPIQATSILNLEVRASRIYSFEEDGPPSRTEVNQLAREIGQREIQQANETETGNKVDKLA